MCAFRIWSELEFEVPKFQNETIVSIVKLVLIFF